MDSIIEEDKDNYSPNNNLSELSDSIKKITKEDSRDDVLDYSSEDIDPEIYKSKEGNKENEKIWDEEDMKGMNLNIKGEDGDIKENNENNEDNEEEFNARKELENMNKELLKSYSIYDKEEKANGHSRLPFKNIERSKIKGWLLKRGYNMKSWKKRYFVYDEGLLYYFKTDKDNKILGFIFLFDMVVEVPEKRESNTIFEFLLQTKLSVTYNTMGSDLLRVRTFQLRASTEEDRKFWVDNLSSNDLYKCRIHKYGFLTKRGHKATNWKKRWFIAFGWYIYYYHSKQSILSLGAINCKSVTQCKKYKFDKFANHKNQFKLQLGDPENPKNYYFYTDTKQEMYEWMATFIQGKNYDSSFNTKLAKSMIVELKEEKKKEGKIRRRKDKFQKSHTNLTNPVLANILNDY